VAPASPGARLPVQVINGNLKFVNAPLMLGHYQSASLTGAEYVVNLLIGGLMADSLGAGRYPDQPGTAQVFANTRIAQGCSGSMPRPTAMPSVSSASQPSASKRRVLAAAASAARALMRAARRGVSNLNGSVTLQPRAPLAAKPRSTPSKPSIGHSSRVYVIACPVARANSR